MQQIQLDSDQSRRDREGLLDASRWIEVNRDGTKNLRNRVQSRRHLDWTRLNLIQLRHLDTLRRGEHDWSRLFSIDLDRPRSIEVNPEAADQRREKMRGNYYDWSKKLLKYALKSSQIEIQSRLSCLIEIQSSSNRETNRDWSSWLLDSLRFISITNRDESR